MTECVAGNEVQLVGIGLADAGSIEHGLAAAVGAAGAGACPPGLARALDHAVFPGGKRLRPRLLLAVARACGGDDPELAMAAACAVELLHCASLVHDDLPCFDAAVLRRGRPSVHAAHGERLAVLAGDALIVMAFEGLATAASRRPERIASLVAALARAVGAPSGIAAGQAWECEAAANVEVYHRAKTGALFAGATAAGALVAGHAAEGWREFGERLGLAFQAADDLIDVIGDEARAGKPVGRDAALDRPSLVSERGVAGARSRAAQLIAEAIDAIPDCPGRENFRRQILAEAGRFVPAEAARVAA